MQIILDANVYATDYRMKGVSFRTLFEYLRRTDSRIVLPRSIREEVILSYGRRLKAEAKEFAEVWNRYRYLELDYDRGLFDKPDVGDAQKALRRILRKPFGGIPTIFVAQMEGVSVEEVFIRGARRKRPANEQGEELRDVIIWLWVLSYSDTAGTQVAFISGDSGFWAKDAPHPDIQHDLQSKGGRVSIYKTIDDFIKSHAPAPTPVTAEWVEEHLPIQTIEPELLQKVSADLAKELRAVIRDLTLEHSELYSQSHLRSPAIQQIAFPSLHVCF